MDSENEVLGHLKKKYDIIDMRSGSMGIVYIAGLRGSQEKLAFKTFSESWFSDAFEEEINISVALPFHPHLVSLYDVFKIAGRWVFCMEYVGSTTPSPERSLSTLKDYLEEDKETVRQQVSDWAYQLCLGLEVLHRNEVLHLDLKPANIFITEDKTVKVGDFGISKVKSSWERFAADFEGGSMGFLSPEQLCMAGEYIDRRSDVFSFGAVLYTMLTGRLFDFDIPFEEYEKGFVSAHEYFYKNDKDEILKDMYYHRALGSEEWGQIVAGCLDFHPQRRYEDIYLVRESLEAASFGAHLKDQGTPPPDLKVTDWLKKARLYQSMGKHGEALDLLNKIWNEKHEAIISKSALTNLAQESIEGGPASS